MSNICKAGDLRHRVTVQSRSLAANTVGQQVETWTNVGTFWGFVRPLTGREFLLGQQLKADVTHQITLRFIGDYYPLNPTMRIQFGSRYFNIESVINVDERNHTYVLMVNEVVEQ